ncbi:hypothetical protein [Pseudoroseomonas ludipueritiae]|nr:hypothetical protein [Roseomonas sp. ACRSG]
MSFTRDDELRRIAEGVMARSLPKSAWTHAAHVGAAVWIIARCPELVPERDMPRLIRAYNEASGTPNTDTGGYHETITLASLRAAAFFLAGCPAGLPLHAACNALLESPLGRRDWMLAHWSRERLFSVPARRGWVEPDVAPLPF